MFIDQVLFCVDHNVPCLSDTSFFFVRFKLVWKDSEGRGAAEYWEGTSLFHRFNRSVAVLLFSKAEVLIKLLCDLRRDEGAMRLVFNCRRQNTLIILDYLELSC